MRHRISGIEARLGNPDPIKLANNFDIEQLNCYKEFGDEAIKKFRVLRYSEGFDFNFENNILSIGIEPAYMDEELQIIGFDFNDKQNSYMKTGISRGYYGSKILEKIKYYKDYKRKNVFKDFIDKWYDVLLKDTNKIQDKKGNKVKEELVKCFVELAEGLYDNLVNVEPILSEVSGIELNCIKNGDREPKIIINEDFVKFLVEEIMKEKENIKNGK